MALNAKRLAPPRVAKVDDASVVLLKTHPLNAVCAYYTMYPLAFPVAILRARSASDRWVLDPFCGRGTTNLAARLAGLRSIGIDSSPVATAIARSKIAWSTPGRVLLTARRILQTRKEPSEIPQGAFWRRAFDATTLRELCVLREALLEDCTSDTRIMLRAILLGALHGPLSREQSYFSNQCPRTFAPKPRYALQYWRKNRLQPPSVDVLGVLWRRAVRYLERLPPPLGGVVVYGDSRKPDSFSGIPKSDWVITSPPYYGMRTYIPDQWLRSWFVGGPSYVEYAASAQLVHTSPEVFSAELRSVWQNAAKVSRTSARLVCRFGGLRDRRAEPLEVIRSSFQDSGWRVTTARPAGTALDGRRQATQFQLQATDPHVEYDVYARPS